MCICMYVQNFSYMCICMYVCMYVCTEFLLLTAALDLGLYMYVCMYTVFSYYRMCSLTIECVLLRDLDVPHEADRGEGT